MTSLFELPNELFYHIFVYLRSDDLLRIFVKLRNRRFTALLHAYVRHLDLSSITITDFSIDRLLSNFPIVNHLHIKITLPYSPFSPQQLHVLSQVKTFVFSYDNDKKPRRLSDVAQYLWHENSHVEHLSILNCFVLQKGCFLPASTLTVN
jgi:hypothetical protein